MTTEYRSVDQLCMFCKDYSCYNACLSNTLQRLRIATNTLYYQRSLNRSNDQYLFISVYSVLQVGRPSKMQNLCKLKAVPELMCGFSSIEKFLLQSNRVLHLDN